MRSIAQFLLASSALLGLVQSAATSHPTKTPRTTTPPTNLVVTAIVAENNASSFECWSLLPPLQASTGSGTVGALSYASLGATTNTSSYVLFSQPTNAGLHGPPAAQWVFLMKGKGVLSLPIEDTTTGQITLGNNYTVFGGDILIAVDTKDVSALGHNSVWEAGTVAVQLPFATGQAPEHEVLSKGGCPRD